MKDIKAKLGSRKFWVALAGCVAAFQAYLNAPAESIEKVAAIIAAVGVLVVYLLAEASIDRAAASQHPGVVGTPLDISSQAVVVPAENGETDVTLSFPAGMSLEEAIESIRGVPDVDTL